MIVCSVFEKFSDLKSVWLMTELNIAAGNSLAISADVCWNLGIDDIVKILKGFNQLVFRNRGINPLD